MLGDTPLGVTSRTLDAGETRKLLNHAVPAPTLLIDGAAYVGMAARMEASRLETHSLFGQADLNLLADEAPWLAQLSRSDFERSNTLLVFLQQGDTPEPFIALSSDVTPLMLRTHLKKWLSVRLPETAPERTPEDKPVLFRFYDPAILAAFLGTLTISEAQAFFGPIQEITIVDEAGSQAFTQTAAAGVVAEPLPREGGLYRITPEQYLILSNLRADTFRQDLFRFLRTEYALETKDMSDGQVRGLIAQSIKDGETLGDKRQGSILNLVIIRLLRPDIMEDEFIWDQVTVTNPEAADPKQRVGLLHAYLFTDFKDVDAFDAHFARISKFWEGAN